MMILKRANKRKEEVQIIKPADNRRFGASGGVFSADSGWATSSFALVRAFVIPPPASSRRSLCASRGQRSAFGKRKRQSVAENNYETQKNE